MVKLIACATNSAIAISSAICPEKLRGQSRMRFTPPIPSQARDFGRERIAAAPYRLDQLGALGISLDLAAQAADLIVDRTVERGGFAALGEIEQLVAGQHLARARHQRVEQVI